MSGQVGTITVVVLSIVNAVLGLIGLLAYPILIMSNVMLIGGAREVSSSSSRTTLIYAFTGTTCMYPIVLLLSPACAAWLASTGKKKLAIAALLIALGFVIVPAILGNLIDTVP